MTVGDLTMIDSRILVATDGTEHGKIALLFAADLAKNTGAELTVAVVNVVSGGGRGPLFYQLTDDQAKSIAQTAADDAKRTGLTVVNQVVLTGREAASEIIDYAEENKCGVIVTGTGDKRGISRLLLGSVAADVARRAHCTVVIAR